MKKLTRLFLLIQALVLCLGFTPSFEAGTLSAAITTNEVRAPQQQFIEGIENAPLILSNVDSKNNSLQGSVYELLNQAKSSILMFSFTFSDPEVIRIINDKASDGCVVQIVIDRDHFNGFQGVLHPDIKVDTRTYGDGHVHHKILVVDQAYIWLSSANFSHNSLTQSHNVAVGFYSEVLATQLHHEAMSIAGKLTRTESAPLSAEYGEELLELYILPHNDPKAPSLVEAQMNQIGEQKIIDLINSARHHLRISVNVWTFKDASRAVINASRRGVQVDVVVGDLNSDAVRMLTQSGIQVRLGKHLHHKFMLVDEDIFLNGSPNWSMNAFSRSDESFVVLYNLGAYQLQAIESSLVSADLPVEMNVNEQAEEVNSTLSSEVLAKIELVNRTLERLEEEIQQEPKSQEHLRQITIARRLSKDLGQFIPRLEIEPVPGACLYEGKDWLANVVDIAEKQARVLKAISYIQNTNDVDQKVANYFFSTLNKLRRGINVPLPDYFHATRTGLESIIESKTILQSSSGYTGSGVYVSNNNEGNHGYGSHTFAIDKSCLVDTVATFRTGRHPITNVFYSLWASVLKDIPIQESNIAFIDTSLDDVPHVEALLAEQGLEIEVLDRNSAEDVLRIFDLTTKRRELPSFFWKKFRSDDYLPQNTYPRSTQGTFRIFLFSLDDEVAYIAA